MPVLWRPLVAELLGTGRLVTVVVGSGVMAPRLSDDIGLQLLANSTTTAMGLAVLILFGLPWLDRSPVKSIRYRGAYYKIALVVFVISFMVLAYLGTVPTNVWGQFGEWLGGVERATVVARIGTLLYFLFFLLMPWYSRIDKTKPVPERVTK